MKEENEREQRVEEVTVVDKEVATTSKDEVRRVLKRVTSGEAVLMIDLWRYGSLAEVAAEQTWALCSSQDTCSPLTSSDL